jgi:hypothetical protein
VKLMISSNQESAGVVLRNKSPFAKVEREKKLRNTRNIGKLPISYLNLPRYDQI